jgi:polyisoprenoid-binding protein YceI
METQAAVTTKWVIDPAHSEIQFKVKHLVITTVTGQFNQFTGSIEADEDFSELKAEFEADINSISTNNEQRDAHLRSEEFFHAAQHPKLTFVSTDVVKKNSNEFAVTGDLTIRGVTKPVTLNVELTGTAVDPWGQTKAGFELTGVISRKEFGLTWNAMTEAGGAVVSDDVRLVLNVQVIKQG